MKTLKNFIIYDFIFTRITFVLNRRIKSSPQKSLVMKNIHNVCDYVIFRLKSDEDRSCTNLKLQKLLYYIQSWNLALTGEKMFDGKFQAWIHGPVNREIYDRFKETKGLYSEMELTDIATDYNAELSDEDKARIDNVLEVYAGFASFQLEKMTHDEDPWINARKGYMPTERCEVEIDEDLMRNYYANRLK